MLKYDAVLSLIRTVLGIMSIVWFHMKLRIELHGSVNNCVGLLVQITSNLHIVFCKQLIFTMLILGIHDHGRLSPLLISSTTSIVEDFYNFFHDFPVCFTP